VYDADRRAFRKYADHSFREYEAGAGWDSEALREMTWEQLPVEVQNRGEAYGIVCGDATDQRSQNCGNTSGMYYTTRSIQV
jgi:hypothetical protein